jgi:hypothetical protein
LFFRPLLMFLCCARKSYSINIERLTELRRIDMYKEEILGLLGAVITYLVAYYGFLNGVEFLQFVSAFLAGAFTTFVFQHRLQVESEKRKIGREDAITMRDKVYGPMFMMVSEILESMERVSESPWETVTELEKMKTEYLFYNIGQDLKSKFYTLLERLNVYTTVFSSAQVIVLRKIRKVVENLHDKNISVSLNQVRLRLEKVQDAIGVGSITLEEAILRRTSPSDFIKSRKEVWGDDLHVDVSFGGEKKSISDFELLYETVLKEMETDPLFQEEEKQRKNLVRELEAFLSEIKSFISAQSKV